MNKLPKDRLSRNKQLVFELAAETGLPAAIIAWRLDHRWPVHKIGAKTIDERGMH